MENTRKKILVAHCRVKSSIVLNSRCVYFCIFFIQIESVTKLILFQYFTLSMC